MENCSIFNFVQAEFSSYVAFANQIGSFQSIQGGSYRKAVVF